LIEFGFVISGIKYFALGLMSEVGQIRRQVDGAEFDASAMLQTRPNGSFELR